MLDSDAHYLAGEGYNDKERLDKSLGNCHRNVGWYIPIPIYTEGQ